MNTIETNVVNLVTEHFEITPQELFSKRRLSNICSARHWIAFIFKTKLDYSYPQIGRLMEKDHTTIIHSVKNIYDLIAVRDAKITSEYRELMNEKIIPYLNISKEEALQEEALQSAHYNQQYAHRFLSAIGINDNPFVGGISLADIMISFAEECVNRQRLKRLANFNHIKVK